MKTYFLFLDTETVGLNYEQNGEYKANPMLECAYILTDIDLNVLQEAKYLVNRNITEITHLMNDYVKKLHTDSGLLDKIAKSGNTISYIDKKISKDIKDIIGASDKLILAGNSVHFDYEVVRRHLPRVFSMLYRRNLDVSSLNVFYRDICGNEELAEKGSNKIYKHTALEDIKETINELKLYKSFELLEII